MADEVTESVRKLVRAQCAFMTAQGVSSAVVEVARAVGFAASAEWHVGRMRPVYGTLNRGMIAKAWPRRYEEYMRWWRRSGRYGVFACHLASAGCYTTAAALAAKQLRRVK